MRKRSWLVCAVLSWLVTGCGSSVAPVFLAAGPASESAPPASRPDSFAGADSDVAKSGGVSPAAQDEPMRRGLGTAWGETRASSVHDVAFVRADAGRPWSIASVRYDDRGGVGALAAFQNERSGRVGDLSDSSGAVTVSIRDSHGDPLDAFRRGGRTYVVGREGERYSIALVNHTSRRFEVVASVDGVDVVSGRPGALSRRGYLIAPYATLEIDGFRQSREAVAAFRFSRVAESYAAQTGGGRDVGVIGVALFSERGDPVDASEGEELQRRDEAVPFPGSDPRFARPPR